MWRDYISLQEFDSVLQQALTWVTNLGDTAIWILLILGLLQCFFGYRMFLFYVWMIGAIIGAFVAQVIVLYVQVEEPLSYIAYIIGILAGGFLLVALHRLGVFVIGAFIGIGLLVLYSEYTTTVKSEASYIIVAIVVGIVAVVIEKHIIIFITAFSGSYIVVRSALLGGFLPIKSSDGTPLSLGDFSFTVMAQTLTVLSVLALLGIIVQYNTTKDTL